MRNQFHIALRYLFAKKTHNVINIISVISAAGIAIGSMALVLILSVYNGFDSSIREIYEGFKADFTITPSAGKTLYIEPALLQQTSSLQEVKSVHTIIEENVFIKYGSKETIALMRGIDSLYLESNPLGNSILEGKAQLALNEVEYAIMGEVLAYSLQARVRFQTPIEIFFPKKDANVTITNPLESVNYRKLFHGATIKGQGTDESSILYVPQKAARALTGNSENEFSTLEIFLHPEADKEMARKSIQNLYPRSIVKDKLQQNDTLYKMMKAEKAAIYLILFFITAIISINIFSCLSMMIAEKREDIATFLGLGATKEFIKRIFLLHGTFISLAGCLVGTVLGLLVAWGQQTFGFVSMPGNYMLSAFPVEIQFADVMITVIGVCGIGFLISYLPAQKFFKN